MITDQNRGVAVSIGSSFLNQFIRVQRKALLQVREKDNDAAIASEATSLAEKELTVIWYQVLNQVNVVSKRLQSKDMYLDNAISELNKLIEFFKDYQDSGFSKAIDEAKEIASDMGVDPVFPQRPEENFKVNYFIYIVDKATSSLETRFQQFKEYDTLFGFLFPHNYWGIEDKNLKSSSHRLEKALRFEIRSDIDVEELYMELKLFETLETSELSNPIDVLKFMKELDYFPNACIAYRILLTIPVTVAFVEKSFSKLNLLKSYLRSTMTQERLSGLATISIENEILESINYEELINQFAIKNARRASRIIVKLVLGESVKTAMAPPAVTTTLVTPKSNPPILRNPRTTGVNPDASPQDSNLRPPLGKPRTIAKRPD
ncbi:hypothetical protein LXL04_037136 [Taraxacum kok-saghyz]